MADVAGLAHGLPPATARTLYGAIAAPGKTLEFTKVGRYLQEPATARARTADLITAWVASRVH